MVFRKASSSAQHESWFWFPSVSDSSLHILCNMASNSRLSSCDLALLPVVHQVLLIISALISGRNDQPRWKQLHSFSFVHSTVDSTSTSTLPRENACTSQSRNVTFHGSTTSGAQEILSSFRSLFDLCILSCTHTFTAPISNNHTTTALQAWSCQTPLPSFTVYYRTHGKLEGAGWLLSHPTYSWPVSTYVHTYHPSSALSSNYIPGNIYTTYMGNPTCIRHEQWCWPTLQGTVTI